MVGYAADHDCMTVHAPRVPLARGAKPSDELWQRSAHVADPASWSCLVKMCPCTGERSGIGLQQGYFEICIVI
jgi:hypothetical protein